MMDGSSDRTLTHSRVLDVLMALKQRHVPDADTQEAHQLLEQASARACALGRIEPVDHSIRIPNRHTCIGEHLRRRGLAHPDRARQAKHNHVDDSRQAARSASVTPASRPNHRRNPGRA